MTACLSFFNNFIPLWKSLFSATASKVTSTSTIFGAGRDLPNLISPRFFFTSSPTCEGSYWFGCLGCWLFCLKLVFVSCPAFWRRKISALRPMFLNWRLLHDLLELWACHQFLCCSYVSQPRWGLRLGFSLACVAKRDFSLHLFRRLGLGIVLVDGG